MYTEIKDTGIALTVIATNPAVLEILNTIPEPARKPIIDDYLLKAVIAAVNMMPENENEQKLEKPWIPDFTDGTTKYALWPDIVKDDSKPSGFGLSYFVYGHSYSYTFCGSRLTFRSRSRAKFVFDNYLELIESVYLVDKPKQITG